MSASRRESIRSPGKPGMPTKRPRLVVFAIPLTVAVAVTVSTATGAASLSLAVLLVCVFSQLTGLSALSAHASSLPAPQRRTSVTASRPSSRSLPPAVDRVHALVPPQPVLAVAAGDRVVAVAAADGVVPAFAEQLLVRRAAGELVVP